MQQGKNKRKGLWKVLFGRTAIIALLIVLQIATIVFLYISLEKKMIYIDAGFRVLSIAIIIYLFNADVDDSFKMTWLFTVLLAPIFGTLFYLFVKIQPGTIRIKRKLEYIANRQRPLQEQNWDTYEQLLEEAPGEAAFARYMDTKGWAPVYAGCSAKYLPIGEDFFDEMLLQMEKAEHFIFLEFFILDEGYMWERIIELLQRKAEEGVEVRLMYDGTCSLTLLPYDFYKQVEKCGIRCKPFAQIRPFLSTHQNNRDHRKIVVIDGKTAFTGGINIADEYINRIERFEHWKDSGIMISGNAVKSMTLMFLKMWDVGEKVLTDYDKYLPDNDPDPMTGYEGRFGGYMIPYAASPMDEVPVGRNVYIDILSRAKKYVHIMTPYLILDRGLLDALKFAAQRGVDVNIIMPHVPDKKYAYLLARTYYTELIQAGVKISEYIPGFVHAKVFSCDDERAVVGTINMDFRSLYLHFECAVYLYGNSVVMDIEDDFRETLSKCRRITLKNCRSQNVFGKLAGRVLRIVAPLM